MSFEGEGRKCCKQIINLSAMKEASGVEMEGNVGNVLQAFQAGGLS